MSGGSLSYFYLQLQEHIGDFGDEELDDLVKDLADLFYAREWYLSSDTCKDDWREARDKFKDKWFTEYGRQERIKKYIEEIRSDVLDRFGIDDQKCDTCEYWSHESGNREVFSTPKSEHPERKTGVWLIYRFGSDAQCSECKTFFSDAYDMENSDNYCRHCGAKMEGLKRVKGER